MTKKLNITIPKPCSADWDKMSPCEQGRHCDSCDKTVVDFTRMSSDQMDEFIIQNFDAKICGHFYQKQLDISTNKFHSFFLNLYSKTYQNLKANLPRVAALFVLGAILNLTGCDASKKEEAAKPKIKSNVIEGKVIANPIKGKVAVTPITKMGEICAPEENKKVNPDNSKGQKK